MMMQLPAILRAPIIGVMIVAALLLQAAGSLHALGYGAQPHEIAAHHKAQGADASTLDRMVDAVVNAAAPFRSAHVDVNNDDTDSGPACDFDRFIPVCIGGDDAAITVTAFGYYRADISAPDINHALAVHAGNWFESRGPPA